MINGNNSFSMTIFAKTVIKVRRIFASIQFLLLISVLYSSTGCININKKDKDYLDPDETFLDYQITAAEGNDKLTILLQFRNGEDKDGLRLVTPADVKLDGIALNADSTSKGRYFYEAYRAIDSFAGKHTIVYTDINKKKFKEEFEFQPFVLISSIPDTISRDSLYLEFSGINRGDYISMVITDTAFINDDINRSFPRGVRNIKLNRSDFENLSTGPVQLEFARETSEMINRKSFGGGLLFINYSLKREVFLK